MKMLVTVLFIIVILLLICFLFMKMSSMKGGAKTSIAAVADLVDAFARYYANPQENQRVLDNPIMKDLADEFFKIRNGNEDYIIHGFAEAFICARNAGIKITDVSEKTSNGSYNMVIFCKANGMPSVIRIEKILKPKTYTSKHPDTIDRNKRIYDILRGRHLIAEPILSSAYYKHTYVDDVYPVNWSILPYLQPYENDKHFILYLELLIEVIPILHDNGFVYIDWKHENIMLSEGKVVISDIDFIEIAKVNADSVRSSHWINSETLRKMRGNKQYLKQIDNLIIMRDVLLSMAMDNEDEYKHAISYYYNYRAEDMSNDSTEVISQLKSKSGDNEIDKLYDKYNLNADNLTDAYVIRFLKCLRDHIVDGKPLFTMLETDEPREQYAPPVILNAPLTLDIPNKEPAKKRPLSISIP